MKIMTILGTRPEIIRLSRLIPTLDALCDHVLVHTGQNHDARLSDIFFQELGVRSPDHHLGIAGNTPGERIGQIIAKCERQFLEERPDRLLILGDTDSGLAALPAKRLGIPVYHMEAGNRCHDDRVPEEVNRRVIDHVSDMLLPYTEGSRKNLLREGVHPARVLVTGNPIREVLEHYMDKAQESRAVEDMGLTSGGYVLVTAHRAENVDVPERLSNLALSLDAVQRELGLPVLVSTHPRTAAMLSRHGVALDNASVRFLEPFGFFDFVSLQSQAALVLTDSGTVQEECCLLGVPAVTLRDTTERPETLECGSNILAGVDPGKVLACVRAAMTLNREWQPPAEYLSQNVSSVVARIILGMPPAAGGAA